MIGIKEVLTNVMHSARTFSLGYRKVDGSYSYKEGILGGTKPPHNGMVTLFQGRQPFQVYIDLIVKFDNEIVKH